MLQNTSPGGLPCWGPRCSRPRYPRWRRRKRRPTRCPPGTTGRRSRRSSTFVQATTDAGQPEVRAAGRAHRHVRPGRHAVGRAPDVLAGDVLPRARAGGGQGQAGARESRAVQDRDVRQPRGDREAPDAGPGEDPRRDAHRHVGRRVQRRSEEVARGGQGPALEAALHRAHLPADAGGAEVPARQRLQDLHRHRRRPGLRARVLPSRPTASRPSRWSAPRAGRSTATTRTASRS